MHGVRRVGGKTVVVALKSSHYTLHWLCLVSVKVSDLLRMCKKKPVKLRYVTACARIIPKRAKQRIGRSYISNTANWRKHVFELTIGSQSLLLMRYEPATHANREFLERFVNLII